MDPKSRHDTRPPRRRPGARAVSWAACAVLAGWVGLASAAAQTPQETAGAILADLPRGTPDERGWWVYERALRERDAHVALELMRAVGERFGGVPGDRARLWIVRFFAAAGDRAAARSALPADLGSEAPADLAAEWRYWRMALREPGEEGRVQEIAAAAGGPAADASGPEGGRPAVASGHDPVAWSVQTSIASIEHPIGGNDEARAALAIEGAVRRRGLLEPYIYRLLRAGHPWLTAAGRTLAEASGPALAHAPGAPLLEDLLRETPERAPLAGDADPPRETEPPARFAVQVGAFLQASSAQSLVRELGSHGFDAYVSSARDGEGPPLQRVRLGPCRNLAAAESLGTRLARSLMLPYQIVEEEPGETRAGAAGAR